MGNLTVRTSSKLHTVILDSPRMAVKVDGIGRPFERYAFSVVGCHSTIDITPVSDFDCEHHEFSIADLAEHAVVAYPVAPLARQPRG